MTEAIMRTSTWENVGNPVHVHFDGVTKLYGSLRANHDITFSVRRGTVHALLGENGAGKSTLMRILGGMIPPGAGRVLVNGNVLSRYSPAEARRLGIGMMHQRLTLVDALSAIDNLALTDPRARLGKGRNEYVRAVQTELERYGMSLDLTRPVWTFSQSEKQLFDFFRVLFLKSSLIILDEPTSTVGPVEGDHLLTRVRDSTHRGCTAVLVTHKIREILKFADAVTVLRSGKVVATRQVGETSAEELVRLMVGESHREPHTRLPREATGVGAIALDVRIDQATDLDARRSLRNVRLAVRSGEIMGVAGIAGSGQDLLAGISAGVRDHFSGHVKLDGARAGREKIAFVPSDRHGVGSSADLSVRDNLLVRCYSRPPFAKSGILNQRELTRFAASRCKEFEISAPSLDAPLRVLSGGNVQRVILARELGSAPRAIVAHNPTSGLDVAAAEMVHAALRASVAGGAALLLISDDLDEILLLCDAVLVLHAGKSVGICERETMTREVIGRMMAGLHGGESP